MDIAQHIIRAKADYDEVYNSAYERGKAEGGDTETAYNEGFEDGKQSMIDESKIIEKTVTGMGVVAVNDVSELPHELEVKLSSDTITDFSNVEVRRLGKNLLLYPYLDITGTKEISGVNITDNGDGSITVNGTATSNFSIMLYKNTKQNISGISSGNSITLSKNLDDISQISNFYLCCNYYNENEVAQQGPLVSNTNTSKSGVVTDDWKGMQVYIYFLKDKTYTNLTIRPQIELGSTATEYEPYQEQRVNANVDGTVEGLTSLSPNMTLITNNDINISMTYHRSWGMQTEYDRFWDIFQNYGDETGLIYTYAFSNGKFTDDNYNPKYPIYVASGTTGANYMFSNAKNITDVKQPIYIKATTMTSTFANSGIVIIPLLQVLETTTLGSAFNGCANLEHITFAGVIGNSASFKDSPLLTDASQDSIIATLKDYSGTTTSPTLTVHADVYNRMVELGKDALVTAKNWILAKA